MSNDKLPPLPSAYQYPRPYATPDGRPLFTAEQMRDYALSALEVAPAPAPLTDEPAAWINWSALTGEPRLGWQCESEIASEPLYRKAKP
jgi:hypothetical protein